MSAIRLAAFVLACAVALPLRAGPLRDRLEARMEDRRATSAEISPDADTELPAAAMPPGVRVRRDIAYGSGDQQTLDVYLPSQRLDAPAPVVFMVHGGAWRIGDKRHAKVVKNKLARWAPRGFVFVSINYPMLPAADPLAQAGHVADALAYAQRHAAEWGADPARFILMGHSAGAHLVALLSADPSLAAAHGAQPWLGTVALDSAAMNVASLMQARHLPLYDKAFGTDADYWRRASPTLVLKPDARPLLAVCSSRRADSCLQARRHADAARHLGANAAVLPEDLSHAEINDRLGLPGEYTDSVEQFMAGLDARVAAALKSGN